MPFVNVRVWVRCIDKPQRHALNALCTLTKTFSTIRVCTLLCFPRGRRRWKWTDIFFPHPWHASPNNYGMHHFKGWQTVQLNIDALINISWSIYVLCVVTFNASPDANADGYLRMDYVSKDFFVHMSILILHSAVVFNLCYRVTEAFRRIGNIKQLNFFCVHNFFFLFGILAKGIYVYVHSQSISLLCW